MLRPGTGYVNAHINHCQYRVLIFIIYNNVTIANGGAPKKRGRLKAYKHMSNLLIMSPVEDRWIINITLY